jgi:hypothetical protein
VLTSGSDLYYPFPIEEKRTKRQDISREPDFQTIAGVMYDRKMRQRIVEVENIDPAL